MRFSREICFEGSGVLRHEMAEFCRLFPDQARRIGDELPLVNFLQFDRDETERADHGVDSELYRCSCGMTASG